jgi:hypothetical protein
MMRQGQNPAKKDVPAYQAESLGIATLVYIPMLEGYFAQSWEVFRRHIASLRQYTSEPFNYLVFDNGSCSEVKHELARLHEAGWIDWLVLSEHNLGKTGALNMILAGMPNEWVCFADSDMLFRPGWLDESWKIERAFPNCGMIGAQVIFPDWDVDRGNTAFRQTQDARFHFEQIQPEVWIVEEYCRARGITGERREKYASMPLDRVTARESGVQAILGGNSHQQFLARAAVLREVLPLPASLQLSRKEDTYQDAEIDRRGYLHLTTTVPYLYHMGNSLDEELNDELARLKLPDVGEAIRQPVPRQAKNHPLWKALDWLSRRPQGKKLLTRLYDNLYGILSAR